MLRTYNGTESEKECVYMYACAVYLKLTQPCKSTTIKIFFLKNRKGLGGEKNTHTHIPCLSSFEIAMKPTPYLKKMSITEKNLCTYPVFSEDLNAPWWQGKAQLYRRAPVNKGGRNTKPRKHSATSHETTDSGKNYQLLSKPRGKQFAGTKVTTYFL